MLPVEHRLYNNCTASDHSDHLCMCPCWKRPPTFPIPHIRSMSSKGLLIPSGQCRYQTRAVGCVALKTWRWVLGEKTVFGEEETNVMRVAMRVKYILNSARSIL